MIGKSTITGSIPNINSPIKKENKLTITLP